MYHRVYLRVGYTLGVRRVLTPREVSLLFPFHCWRAASPPSFPRVFPVRKVSLKALRTGVLHNGNNHTGRDPHVYPPDSYIIDQRCAEWSVHVHPINNYQQRSDGRTEETRGGIPSCITLGLVRGYPMSIRSFSFSPYLDGAILRTKAYQPSHSSG